MIFLERFREDPLLLDAFESNVAEWVKGMEDSPPDLSGVSRSFFIKRHVPEELKNYREVAKRWKQLPLTGRRRRPQLANRPEYFRLDGSGSAEIAASKQAVESNSNHFIKIVKGGVFDCSCCWIGIRCNASQEWEFVEVEDHRLKERLGIRNPAEYLLEWGLSHFTHQWILEEEAEFEVFRKDSQEIWTTDKRSFWFHEDGVFGMSYGPSGDNRIAVQSRKRIGALVGREL